MDKDSRIRDAQSRIIDILKKKPKMALSTLSGTAVIQDGLTCTFTQGEVSAMMDMPEIMGGDATAPTPGFYARAGIAGCISIGIKQTAVMAGVVFDKVEVEIETDFDDGAAMGLSETSAAPTETRLIIHVTSDLSKPEVSTLIDKALEMDPWFLALRDAQSVKFNLEVGK